MELLALRVYPDGMKGLGLFAALIIFVLLSPDVRADAVSDCSAQVPWGAPTISHSAKIDYVCHAGYLSALDAKAKVPRWVAYELTGQHTLGCLPRSGLQFKVDAAAPAEDQGRVSDYSHSGYDLGHMAPNQDFAWDAAEQRDTFSFANVSPQLPGLNRQGWERGEEIVRAWALQRGAVEVYVGPILESNDKSIGTDAIVVPSKQTVRQIVSPDLQAPPESPLDGSFLFWGAGKRQRLKANAGVEQLTRNAARRSE